MSSTDSSSSSATIHVVEPGLKSRPEGSADLQLYSLGTPNGQKITIALEELGVPYDAWTINIMKNIQFEDWFKQINPNSKIPTLVDKKGPGGKEVSIMESGAILLYLAEKYGKLLPTDPVQRLQTIQWLFWQVGGLGPMTGQMNHFVLYCKEDIPYAKERYTNETIRLFKVMDTQLAKTKYLAGEEFTIADCACFGWVLYVWNNPKYAKVVEGLDNLKRWVDLVNERPAVKKGLAVNKMH